MSMPLLTVIMSTYNESLKELDLSINSILNQTFKDFIFIIVDDNPTSHSLKSYLLSKADNDKRIRLLINTKNSGLVKSLNRALKHAHSPLIARMDADDISKKDRFYKQIRFIRKYNLDLSFTNSETIFNGKLNTSSVFFNKKIINQKLLKYMFSHYANIALHSTWMLKKSVYTKLHGYRNVFAAEDFDFIIRAITYGFKLGYEPDNLFIWRQRRNGITKSNVFKQFVSSYILQKYARKYKYKKIIPIDLIYSTTNRILTPKSVNKFHKFLLNGHNVKYHYSFNNLCKFIESLIKSNDAKKYMFKLITTPLEEKKVVSLINKH